MSAIPRAPFASAHKYLARRRPRQDGHKWCTFVKNHSHELFACDFMTQYTALFPTVCGFIVMEISTLNAAHVGSVAREFIEYYNRARPSQATHAIPDPDPELIDRPLAGGKLIALPMPGGVQHGDRLAA